ncbi:MAG TPA: transglutaminase-like domain-containing protein [Candidatus Agrococcus pullicola]|uniref:Transglutaminase-like domain-containing protein n=1 Tax=Candidatus Agrococcus pullicola TaxID=2838429 RepID=A0A9D1YXY4_9MICO|nr:transglutaminase-like domain-containing protein [Candidatus Agrococcus pullicola]
MTRKSLLQSSRIRKSIDLAVMFVLFSLVTLTFGPVFGGFQYLIAGIGGAAVGIGVGVLTSSGPFKGWLYTTAGVVLAYVVFGVALAVPSKALWGFLPTLSGLRDLMLGIVFSWKEVLTAEPPVGTFAGLLTVPFLTMLVCSSLSTVFALRMRKYALWAVAPVFAALVIGIVFGTKMVALPWLIGVAVVVIALAWSSWRMHMFRKSLAEETALDITDARRLQKTQGRKRLLGATAMLVGAAVLGSSATFAVEPTNRSILRDVVEPPVDVEQYPSPLAGYRGWIKNYENETLMTVEGMPADARLRIATMDYHDGDVYAVAGARESGSSGSYSRIGDRVEGAAEGEPATVRVEIDQYSGIWLPTTGSLQSMEFEGDRAPTLHNSLHYNGSTDSAIVTQQLRQGDAYEFTTFVSAPPDQDDLRGVEILDVDVPRAEQIPDLLQAWVATHAEGNTTLEIIQSLEQRLQAGAFSHGLESDEHTSLAGHSLYRLDTMFRGDIPLGDDEQYAVAFALAMQQIGVPARVVMGLYPNDEFTGSSEPVNLRGTDMHAWVEIPFAGYGWVPFNPTPPEDNTEIEPEPEPEPDPRPQVLQPPQPPEEPAELTPEVQPDQGEEIEDDDSFNWVPILMTVLISLLAILLLLSPFIIVGVMKLARRKRRREASDPSSRLSGGWHEVVDQAVDLGLDVPGGVTRTTVAASVGERYPESRAVSIGAYVDERVFGPERPGDEEVEAFWSDVEQSLTAMRGEASRWERLKSKLSIRSFLRHARSRRRKR